MSTPESLVIRGACHIVGDDVNTDYLVPSRYKSKMDRIAELVPHLLEDIEPGFAEKVRPGDILVAGHNFGSGSSRETAPRVLLAAGIRAVVAKSFARIFFRNATNMGLVTVECDWGDLSNGETVEIDVGVGRLQGSSPESHCSFTPLPDFLLDVIVAGGTAAWLKR